MKHLKELKLNEDFAHQGYEASTFADISTESIISTLKRVLIDLDDYNEKFFVIPEVKRYLENYAKDLMNKFWGEIKDKKELQKLSDILDRESEGPDHPFFPPGVFDDPTRKK